MRAKKNHLISYHLVSINPEGKCYVKYPRLLNLKLLVNISLREPPKQEFFQTPCHNTAFLLHIDFVKGERTFLMPKASEQGVWSGEPGTRKLSAFEL